MFVPSQVNTEPRTSTNYLINLHGIDDAGLGQSLFLEVGWAAPVNDCFLVNTAHDVMTNVNYSDATLFYLWKFLSLSWAYPRKPNQNYVMFLLEPPGTYLSNLKDLPNFFNWTMTYRHDSDIYRPYGYFRPLNGSSKMVDPRETPVRWKQPTMSSDALEEYLNLSKRKTKLVAWFVSQVSDPGEEGGICRGSQEIRPGERVRKLRVTELLKVT
uniref:Fucosyltransferase N-terminal domain-containing protein n=1 Tax=Timema douglasi TaxID=61478 RepID=A0A7R8VL17_TIMDO|nr:unnamed protein product [Timema douglasi]